MLVKRYKRFLADVELPGSGPVTAFVANTGSLLTCAEPGQTVWLSDHGDERKYRYRWVLGQPGRDLVCVDTSIPNAVVREAAVAQQIPQLSGYLEYISEMPLGERSRSDLLCRVHRDDMLQRCWVEVKATTLLRDKTAQFPDARTERGRKHLREMRARVEDGDRAVQLFFVQRSGCACFRPADDIDPQYGAELRAAAAAGVEIIALEAAVTKREITIGRQIPVEL